MSLGAWFSHKTSSFLKVGHTRKKAKNRCSIPRGSWDRLQQITSSGDCKFESRQCYSYSTPVVLKNRTGCALWVGRMLLLSPLYNHSGNRQSYASVSSCMRMRADSALIRVCYTAVQKAVEISFVSLGGSMCWSPSSPVGSCRMIGESWLVLKLAKTKLRRNLLSTAYYNSCIKLTKVINQLTCQFTLPCHYPPYFVWSDKQI